MSFATEMKKERLRLNMTQDALSRKSSIAQQTISAIERGYSEPTEHTMIMIANAIGCTVGKLLGEEKSIDDINGLESDIISLMLQLDRDDYLRVRDFDSGLIAARIEAPSRDPS